MNSDENDIIIRSDGEVEGRSVDDSDFKKETEEEQFNREQRKAIYRLINTRFPQPSLSDVCSVCGKKDFPLYVGNDGGYYCRNHILPENRNAEKE